MVKAMFCAEKTGVALYGAQESPYAGNLGLDEEA